MQKDFYYFETMPNDKNSKSLNNTLFQTNLWHCANTLFKIAIDLFSL